MQTKNQTAPLQITTLGHFQVKRGDMTFSEESRRSQKIWTLFKYLITHRKRRIPAEEFNQILWANEDCANPAKALQNLVYRLRTVLAQNGPQEIDAYIQYSQGCYYWNPSVESSLDIEQFDNEVAQGILLEQSENPYGAVECYRRAMALYQGNYLPESSYVEWLMPIANHYNRMYLSMVGRLSHLLRALKLPEESIGVCEAAFRIEPYAEPLHVTLIESLMDLNKPKQARQHYEYITSTLYREFGIRPSQDLRDTYRRVHDGLDQVQMDLDILQELLTEKGDTSGAYFCDPDTFSSIYNLEARRADRTGQVVFLMIITLLSSNFSRPEPPILQEAMATMNDVLVSTLRRGDVVGRWNDSQFILLLPTLTFEDGEMVLRRLSSRFTARYPASSVIVRHKLQPVIPLSATKTDEK